MTWLVGACQTRREAPLAKRLSEDGIEAYTPVWLPTADTDPIAVFPSYLFVKSGEGDQGVVSVAAYARERYQISMWYLSPGRAGTVTNEYIASLKAREANGAFDRKMEIESKWFRINERVRIRTGPCCGLEAVILGFRGKRVRLDLPLLGDRCWFPTINLKRAEDCV